MMIDGIDDGSSEGSSIDGQVSEWVHPTVRRQNRCFVSAVVTLAIGAAFLSYKYDGISFRTSRTQVGTTRNKDPTVYEKKNHIENDEAKDFERDHKKNENAPVEFSNWLETEIRLDDGVMFEVVEQLSHDESSFTQGLTYANGVLYESAGLYGHSSVRKLNPDTGVAEVIVPMQGHVFGEGMVYLGGRLIQITWKSGKGYIYNASDLSQAPEQFAYETTNGQGWGITHDPAANELIVSDGTNNLHFWKPSELGKTIRKIPVRRHSGKPAKSLNELEFWRGRVLANVWYEDVLLVIDPETGTVEKEYDFSNLWPQRERPTQADVFNGISVSADPSVLYVTGKQWNRIYKIRLLP